jgi:endonuclease/exonuclease/phosphatase family metal-dependent hydrolase
MKKSYAFIIAFALFFLFFIQMAGILVESIYILDLMNTNLDAKVLGLLFFFAPVLLIPFHKKFPNWIVWFLFGLLFISRGATPYLNTLGRMLASGIGTGAALLLFPFLAISRPKDETHPQIGLAASAGLALAVGLSVLLRTINFSIDYSLTPPGGWVGWGLGLLFGWILIRFNWDNEPSTPHSSGRIISATLGIFLTLTLTYFAFSAPAVIARWTQGNYFLIVTTVSLFSVGWAYLLLNNSALLNRISPRGLLIWNLLFTLSLTATILAHRVSFPQTPDSPAVVVGNPSWIQQIPLVLMLLLFPVIFLDMYIFFNTLQQEKPSPRALIPGMLWAGGALILLVFINIFTNVWGYVQPVSGIFRNQYYLPYLLMAAGITLLGWRQRQIKREPLQGRKGSALVILAILLGYIFLATVAGFLQAKRPPSADPNKTSLIVMTYNIQEANDGLGERSYERQLALIQKVSPDILSLQETDSVRISLNNNDYVRYYAGKLGYYSYYGPSTVTGTFGTAILSKYPLQNTRSVFTFSDTDEIGTAEAEIKVGGRVITIYDVHPDGSDTAKLTFAKNLLERASGKADVIALGDYNLRDYEEAYQVIDTVLTNAWTSVYPTKIGADGTDMSGRNRIDHVFISPSLNARNPVYVLPPASATDHPVHWAEVYWGE